MKRTDIELIKRSFEKEGYTLISKEYRNQYQKLIYICPKGHKHNINWSNWHHKKQRCCYCAGNIRKTIEHIRLNFKEEGYTLLSDEYENEKSRLDYLCPNGHKHYISWSNWKSNYRCPYCCGNKKLTIVFIMEQFEKEGYILLTNNYKNSRGKLKYICPNGHIHSINWDNWKLGQRCSKCSNRVSKFEKEVKSFLGLVGIEYISNDRKQIKNPKTNRYLELDIWFPQFKKAIECNGNYWHSDEDRIKCDIIKKNICEEKEIGLLIINNKEWEINRTNCENKIKEFLYM
jgi:hypothetical protein